MSPAADVAKASAGLGSRWETMEVAVKPYPSCRYSHAALDGIAQLRSAAGVEVGEEWSGVTDVRIGLPAAVRCALWPAYLLSAYMYECCFFLFPVLLLLLRWSN